MTTPRPTADYVPVANRRVPDTDTAADDPLALPFGMFWKPENDGSSRCTYRWWAWPLRPFYVGWATFRFRREVRRLRRARR